LRFIEIVFRGGIGNQLFQYAAAKALMQKGDILLFNLDSYKNDYVKRQFGLFNYVISGIHNEKILVNSLLKKDTFFRQWLKNRGLLVDISEDQYADKEQIQKALKFYSILNGYWQSELYFETIKSELIDQFRPRVSFALPDIFSQKNTVAVHVRRTDYLVNERYGVLSMDYYNKAMQFFKTKIFNPIFIIFSDDLEWCKKNMLDDNLFYFEDSKFSADYFQLYFMSNCSHNIIANSSFSWWSAWLNSNKQKIIVRPQNPFLDNKLFNENYYPESWYVF
jgi:hypothetical protein